MASLPLQEKLERVILGSKAAQQHPEEVRGLWQTCGELMFALEPRLRHLGLGKEVRPPTTWGSGGHLGLPGMERKDLMGRQWAFEAKLPPTVGLSFTICKMGSRLGGMLSDILGCCVQREGRGGPDFPPLEATWELHGVSDMSDVASLRGGLACGRLEQSCRTAFVRVTIFSLERDRGGRVEAAEKEAWKVCWEGIHSHPCSLRPQHLCICPLCQQGITTYFSGDCTMEDAKLAQDFLDSQVWGTWSSGWMGLPCHWHSLLGLSLGPETRASLKWGLPPVALG